MIFLKVPYAEKDEAKALGARWNSGRKAWYVPDGQPSAPYERWLISPQRSQHFDSNAELAMESEAQIDSYASKPIVGEHYVVLEHGCSPFVDCLECLPILEQTGWKAAQQIANVLWSSIDSGQKK